MNRMKKAAADLCIHLGADAQGVKLLDAVLREANSIRKELASAQVALKKKDEAVKLLDSRASELTMAKDRLAKELHTVREVMRSQISELTNKQREIDNLEEVLEPPINVPPESELTNKARFKALFKTLRKKMPQPPSPSSAPNTADLSEKAYVFELSNFVSSYNESQYLRLGMFVVVCCAMRWTVGFQSKERYFEGDAKEWRGGEIGKFLRWVMKTWIQDEPAWKKDVQMRCDRLTPDVTLHPKDL